MSDSPHRRKVTIEKLLKLKRYERPSPEFWNQFESELQVKTLQTLVTRPTWGERFQWWLRKSFLWGVPAGGLAAGVLAMVHLVSQDNAFDSEAEPVSAMSLQVEHTSEPATAQPHRVEYASSTPNPQAELRETNPAEFIMDAISSDRRVENKTFRRILYTPSFSVDRGELSQYVADPISSHQRAWIQPAALGAGRNF